MRGKWKSGYSLMEALIVLGLIAAIVLIAIPILSNMLASYDVSTSVSNLEVQIRFARNASLKRKVPFRVIIREETGSPANSYLVQYSESGAWENLQGFYYEMPAGVKILTSSTDGPIEFNSRGAIEGGTPPYIINLEARNKTSYRITVQRNGSVSVIRLS
jgi:Tfp pilus assembly protein FimT